MNFLEVSIRFLHLAVTLLLFGSFSFELLVRRPAYSRAMADTRGGGPLALPSAFQSGFNTHLRIARWSLLIAVCTAVAGLTIKIVSVTGLASAESVNLTNVLSDLLRTQFGTVWTARLIIAGLLALLLAAEHYGGISGDSTALRVIGTSLSALLLMTIAGTGHAAAAEGTALLAQVSSDAVHLLAAGAWLGGLVSFAILFASAKRDCGPPILAMMQNVTERFSRLGLVCVVTLITTGLFNTSYLVGGMPPLLGTPYGHLLLFKLTLLIPLLTFASTNLLYLKPRLSAVTGPDRDEQATRLLDRLKRSVIAEASFGAAILLVVAVMGVTPPARHVQPDWPFSFRLDWNADIKGSPQARSQISYGGALALLGFALLGFAAARHRRRWLFILAGVFVVSGALIAATAISIDAYPTTYRRPAVPYQAISIANGAMLYQDSCTVCHGAAGYGDGPAAPDLMPRPADLTARHSTDHTAGDLYWWLSHGVKGSSMPGFNESLTEDERWDLINFLRALSSSEKGRSLSSLVETEAWLVAPDFVYATNRGETKALKDNRGSKIVLLVLFSLASSTERLRQLDRSHERFTAADVEILLVPNAVERAKENSSSPVANLPIITEGGEEISKTYSLFSHSLDTDRNSADAFVPRHTEFLIDKRGYIRARWIAEEGTGWLKLENLLREVETLSQEKSRAPAPDDHVH